MLAILLLASVAAAAPALIPRVDCVAASSSFAWSVADFYYHAEYQFTTPSHQNSWGYVSFNLTNPATAATTACEARSDQLDSFFYGNQAYKCADADASFKFTQSSGLLAVSQNWDCPDATDPADGRRFQADGSYAFKLSCTTNTYQNPNWTQGQTYSDETIECVKQSAQFGPSTIGGT